MLLSSQDFLSQSSIFQLYLQSLLAISLGKNAAMKNNITTRKSALIGLLSGILIGTAHCQSPVITNPLVEKIWGGFSFVEGPLWVDTLGLLFSDIPANKVYRWSLDSTITVYLTPSGNSNGLALDGQGRLLLAQHGPRQVARVEDNGTLSPLATHYDDKRLNSPNDLAVKSDGSIFFTDPPYGLMDQGGTSELGYNGIYRISPSGDVQLLDNSLYRPNGIAFSPDESKLYVSDCEATRIYVWDVVDDTTLGNKRQFSDIAWSGCTDGMKVDGAGYVYSTGPTGIWIFSPDGKIIDTITVPEQTTNCGWGGTDRTILYVTSGKSIYRIRSGKPVTSVGAVKDITGNIIPELNCFPNPFEDVIRFDYTLVEPGQVTLQVFNIAGQKVITLVDQVLTSGNHSATWNSNSQPSGNYYLKMLLPGKQEIRKGIVKK
jgi:gluconolactonase